MDYSMITLGVGAGVIFIGIVTLLYRIIGFMEQEPDVALSKLFLRDEALLGFKVLAASNFLFTIPLAAEAIALIMGDTGSAMKARYVMPFTMIGYLYFYIQLYRATKPYEN